MKKQTTVFLSIILLIIVIVCVPSVLCYNGLVRAETGVDEARAQIMTTYQRRLDLIPNLVETVKGYAAHEKQTLLMVTEARSKAQGILKEINTKQPLTNQEIGKILDSQAELTNAMRPLWALIENYPNLKASTNFLTLQDQLEGTENRISVARQRYNTALRSYNTKVRTFPNNIIASIFGYQEMLDYFEATEGADKSVQVKF